MKMKQNKLSGTFIFYENAQDESTTPTFLQHCRHYDKGIYFLVFLPWNWY